jgi:hypothetical protein
MIFPVLPPSSLRLFYPLRDADGKTITNIEPSKVFDEFWGSYTLDEIRRDFWDLLKAALENEDNITNPGFITKYYHVYEMVNDLMTAAYILHVENLPPDKKPK